MNTLCQQEVEWVNNHPEMYDGPLHQRAVIRLIANRYELKAAQRTVNNAMHNDNISSNRLLSVTINALQMLKP